MSYLSNLTKEEIVNALSALIKEKRVNTEGLFWTLKYEGYHFSPNIVIRKAGEIIGITRDELKKFEGGNGSSGAITKLKEHGFELVDKRVKEK